ncbi:MAG TPA: DsbA family oxidoreductase [Vulgatibacter sp.]|nr:DsbA family oxidoreductase [Vulgatibacter sp.]
MAVEVEKSPLRIDVISDTVCPWCYLGKRRLEAAMEATADRYEFRVAWHPFQLAPDLPPEGRDWNAYTTERFGSLERLAEMQEHLREVGKEAGIHFAFERIGRAVNTFEAHRLIWMAGEVGLQDEMVEAIFRAYFLEGRDIGDREELVRLAVGVGMDEERIRGLLESEIGVAEVRAELEQARRIGITAVPFFVVDGKFWVAGAQPPKVFVEAFERAAREQA